MNNIEGVAFNNAEGAKDMAITAIGQQLTKLLREINCRANDGFFSLEWQGLTKEHVKFLQQKGFDVHIIGTGESGQHNICWG